MNDIPSQVAVQMVLDDSGPSRPLNVTPVEFLWMLLFSMLASYLVVFGIPRFRK